MLERAKGLQRSFADDSEVLVIRGPGVTVQQIRAAVKRLVDWDLPGDEASLSDLHRTVQDSE